MKKRRSPKERTVALAALPDPCDLCRPFDGAWAESETGGMERCACPRGEQLDRISNPRKYRHEQHSGQDPKMKAAGKDEDEWQNT